jgi:hypothetical protein
MTPAAYVSWGFEDFSLKNRRKAAPLDSSLFGFYLATFSRATNQFLNTRNSTAQNETAEKTGEERR